MTDTATATRTDIVICLDWWQEFVSWLTREEEKSEKTIQAYRSDLDGFMAWFSDANGGQAFTPNLLTSWDVREFKKHLLSLGRSAATINRKLTTLRMLGAWLSESGVLNTNPAASTRNVKQQQLAPKWLPRAEFGRLMRQLEREVNAAQTAAAQLQAVRDQAIIVMMGYAGLRVDEVASLEMAHIELTERKGLVRVLGKGTKFRPVPLAAEARSALRAWLDLRGDQPGELWRGKFGDGITSRQIERRLEEICRLGGIKATPHQLRHSAAKRMLDAGIHITVVAAVLGHESIRTTARYVTPSFDDLEAAVEMI